MSSRSRSSAYVGFSSGGWIGCMKISNRMGRMVAPSGRAGIDAALIGQVGDDLVHPRIVRRGDDARALLALDDEVGIDQLPEMVGERRPWDALHPIPELSDRKPVVAGAHQGAIDGDARWMSQRIERDRGFVGVHQATVSHLQRQSN